jgi:hypothetical protein
MPSAPAAVPTPAAPPAAFAPAPAPVEVAALPVPSDGDPHPEPAEPPASLLEQPIAGAATPCAPIEVRVLPGSSLSSIARDIYGYLPEGAEYARFTSRVKTLNPWITDPNLIFADRTLRVPMDVRPGGSDTP